MKIIIVDNDETDRRAISRCLASIGETDVVEVASGRECLERLAEEKFELMMLDFYLDDCEGLDLVDKMKAIGVSLPIVVVTGLGDEFLRNKLRTFGIDDYITKDKLCPKLLKVTARLAVENHKRRALTGELMVRIKADLEKLGQSLDAKLAEFNDK